MPPDFATSVEAVWVVDDSAAPALAVDFWEPVLVPVFAVPVFAVPVFAVPVGAGVAFADGVFEEVVFADVVLAEVVFEDVVFAVDFLDCASVVVSAEYAVNSPAANVSAAIR